MSKILSLYFTYKFWYPRPKVRGTHYYYASLTVSFYIFLAPVHHLRSIPICKYEQSHSHIFDAILHGNMNREELYRIYAMMKDAIYIKLPKLGGYRQGRVAQRSLRKEGSACANIRYYIFSSSRQLYGWSQGARLMWLIRNLYTIIACRS